MDPGSHVPLSLVLMAVGEAEEGDGPEWVTTEQAATIVGRTSEWWQDEARAGHLPGAHQDGKGSPWLLPLAECRRHLLRLKASRATKRSRRVPWKKAS